MAQLGESMRQGGEAPDLSGMPMDLGGGGGGAGVHGTVTQPKTSLEPTGENSLVMNKARMVGETSFPTRVVVTYEKVGGGTSLKAQRAKAKEAYPGLQTDEDVKLAIGTVAKLTHRVKSRDGENGTIVTYVVVDGEDFWTVRFQTEQDASVVTGVSDQVMATFRPAKG